MNLQNMLSERNQLQKITYDCVCKKCLEKEQASADVIRNTTKTGTIPLGKTGCKEVLPLK